MVDGTKNARSVSMLFTPEGRQDVRERMENNPDALDAGETRVLASAIQAHEHSVLWPDDFAGINGILTRLFLRSQAGPRIFEDFFDTSGKAFVRVEAGQVPLLYRSLLKAAEVKSIQLHIPRIDDVAPELFQALMEYAARIHEISGTTLYATTQPDADGADGDVFVFNLAKVRHNELMVLGQVFQGHTTFYSQGTQSGEVIAFLNELNPSGPPQIIGKPNGGGKGGSGRGGVGSTGGTPDASSGDIGMGAASFVHEASAAAAFGYTEQDFYADTTSATSSFDPNLGTCGASLASALIPVFTPIPPLTL